MRTVLLAETATNAINRMATTKTTGFIFFFFPKRLRSPKQYDFQHLRCLFLDFVDGVTFDIVHIIQNCGNGKTEFVELLQCDFHCYDSASGQLHLEK